MQESVEPSTPKDDVIYSRACPNNGQVTFVSLEDIVSRVELLEDPEDGREAWHVVNDYNGNLFRELAHPRLVAG